MKLNVLLKKIRLSSVTNQRINKKVQFAYIVVILFFSIMLTLTAYFNRPVSDDYYFQQINQSKNPIAMGFDGYTSGNGRFGQYFMFSIYESVFGLQSAVKVAPIINTSLLILASVYFIYTIKKILLKNIDNKSSAVLGVTMAFAMILSARSIFDSSFWLDSSVTYIPSLIFIVLEASIFTHILSRVETRISYKWLATLVLITFIGQQFNEATSVVVIVANIFILATMLFLRKYSKINYIIASSLSSILGLVVIYLSPGSMARRTANHSGIHVHDMFIGSMHYYEYALQNMFSWRLSLVIFLSIVTYTVFRKEILKLSKKIVITLCLLGVILMFVPYYLVFVLSEYAVHDYMALRTYQVPAALMTIGFSMIVIFLWRYIDYHKKNVFTSIQLLAVLVSVLTVGAAFKPLAQLVKAVALRSVAYDSREIMVGKQVQSGVSTIYVNAAPLLLDDAEPGEFIYTPKQIDWFTDSFKKHYHIENKNLVVVPDQSVAYCMSGENQPSWNIQSCENLMPDFRLK